MANQFRDEAALGKLFVDQAFKGPAEIAEVEAQLADLPKRDLSPAEYRAQKISFAVGMLSHDSTTTREEIERLVDSGIV